MQHDASPTSRGSRCQICYGCHERVEYVSVYIAENQIVDRPRVCERGACPVIVAEILRRRSMFVVEVGRVERHLRPLA